MDHFLPYFGKSFDSITIEDILKYFKDEHTESNRIEFKSYKEGGNFNQNLDKLILSICAFLNSEGGIIIWGAPQGKKAANSEEKIFSGAPSFVNEYIEHDKLINKISDKITPLPSGINVRPVGENNEYVYLFEIQASTIKPHQFDNKYMIRLDGQSRIAPHYYIEAMFKQIKYPEIEGFIKFGEVLRNGYNSLLNFEIYIYNWSPFQNEKNINILVFCPNGKFSYYNPQAFVANKYIEYGSDGHQCLYRKLDDILFFGSPFVISEKIEFDRSDIVMDQEIDLFLRFGGELSPQKESYYKLNFKNPMANCTLDIIEMNENRLISDIKSEIGATNKTDVLKITLGR